MKEPAKKSGRVSPACIVVLNGDGSSGCNFIESLQYAKQEGWGAEKNIVSVCSHPLRAQLSRADQAVVMDEPMDAVRAIKEVKKHTGLPTEFIYETKSGSHMLDFANRSSSLPCLIPGPDMVGLFEDKYQTYLHMRKKGYDVAETYLISDLKDLKHAFKSIKTRPVWLRDTVGQAGKGSFCVKDIEEAARHIESRSVWGECTISECLPIYNEIPWKSRLKSEYFPGEMVTWIALYDKSGRLVASQTRKRLYWEHSQLTATGITGYSGANMTIRSKDTSRLAESIIESFPWTPRGPVGIDFVVNQNGRLVLTEVQASRFFTSTYPLSLLGLNLPALLVDASSDVPVPHDLRDPCEEGYLYIQRFGSTSRLIHRDNIKTHGWLEPPKVESTA